MRVIDPGHVYALKRFDEEGEEVLTYVKRMGPKFPGNKTAYPGTILQEAWRADIHRLKYLDHQEHYPGNWSVIQYLRRAIFMLELRAAIRHRRAFPSTWHKFVQTYGADIESIPFCEVCGHILHGGGECRAKATVTNPVLR